MIDRYYNRHEILEVLGISASTLSRLMLVDFPYIRLGGRKRGRVLFDKNIIKEYMNKHMNNVLIDEF